MKKLLRTRRFIIAALVVVIGAPTAWLLARDSAGSDSAIVATVKRGEFKVMVTTAGELRAAREHRARCLGGPGVPGDCSCACA